MRSLSCWRAWKNCSGLVRSYLYHIRNYWSRKAFSVSSIMIILSSNRMIIYRNVLVGTHRNSLAVELFIHVAIKLDNQLCCSLAFIYLVLPFCCHISILISVAPTAKVSSSFFFICVCVCVCGRKQASISWHFSEGSRILGLCSSTCSATDVSRAQVCKHGKFAMKETLCLFYCSFFIGLFTFTNFCFWL